MFFGTVRYFWDGFSNDIIAIFYALLREGITVPVLVLFAATLSRVLLRKSFNSIFVHNISQATAEQELSLKHVSCRFQMLR
jgi:uncharacterized protein (DUF2062 family)